MQCIIVNKGTCHPGSAGDLIKNAESGNRFYWYTLTGGNDNGEFSRKVFVNGKGPEIDSGGPWLMHH